MLTVSEAQYERQRHALAQIIAQEAQLRQELARLSDMATPATRSTAPADRMQAIGADLLWHGWVSRAKVKLNMRLARLLAAKGQEQDKVRKAFGKVIALRELIRAADKEERERHAQQRLSMAIDQTTFPRNEC